MGINCVKTDIYAHASAFVELKPEWMDLLAQSAPRSIFQTPQWQNLWWDNFSDGLNLRILTVRSEEGELLGLCSLAEAEGRFEFLGGKDLCDHLDVLARPGHEETVAGGIMETLADSLPGPVELDLHFIPEDSKTLSPLREAAKGMGWEVTLEAEETSPFILLPPTWEEYLETLRGKDRHELRRKMRRAEEFGVLRIRNSSPAELQEDMDVFLRLHAISAPEKSEFMDDRMREFFRQTGRTLAAEGWLRLTFLELDGTPAAALLCFDIDGALLVYNSGYDTGLSAASPGIALFGYAIREAIRDGRRTFDFLRGNETYKYRLGGRDRPLVHFNLRPNP